MYVLALITCTNLLHDDEDDDKGEEQTRTQWPNVKPISSVSPPPLH